MMEEDQKKAPKSPISSTNKSRVAIVASRTQIAPFQPTRTPGPARKEVQIMMHSVSKDSEPPPSSGNGKGSQTRKQLEQLESRLMALKKGTSTHYSQVRFFFIFFLVGIMAHYWNGGYTIEMVAILLKRWLTIGMMAILLELWLYY